MTESEIATFVKKVLTAEWPDCTWQVLVGRNFGSCVQFEESRYIYFYVGQVRGFGSFLQGLSPRVPRQGLLISLPQTSLLPPSLSHTHTHTFTGWFCGVQL